MASRSIKRKLVKVYRNIQKEISSMSVGKYGRGLASEGYAGGYADAISDYLAGAERNRSKTTQLLGGHFGAPTSARDRSRRCTILS